VRPDLPLQKSKRLLIRLNYSLKKTTKETDQEFKAIEYKTQVVAGTNLYIKITVGDGQYIHVSIQSSSWTK
jgi:cystatin-A/B